MCLCPVIYEVNSTRKLSDVYSLDMIMSEKGGSVVTRIPTLAIHPEMWSSMKYHLGGHPKLVVLPDSGNLETSLQEKLEKELRP
jgi:hypothetical protein